VGNWRFGGSRSWRIGHCFMEMRTFIQRSCRSYYWRDFYKGTAWLGRTWAGPSSPISRDRAVPTSPKILPAPAPAPFHSIAAVHCDIFHCDGLHLFPAVPLRCFITSRVIIVWKCKVERAFLASSCSSVDTTWCKEDASWTRWRHRNEALKR
jgi:hypothetical protein